MHMTEVNFVINIVTTNHKTVYLNRNQKHPSNIRKCVISMIAATMWLHVLIVIRDAAYACRSSLARCPRSSNSWQWCITTFTTRLPGTWQTTAFRSMMWPVDGIFVLLGIITCLCLDTVLCGCRHLLLPAQLPGTNWAMICVIHRWALTVSDVCLKLGVFRALVNTEHQRYHTLCTILIYDLLTYCCKNYCCPRCLLSLAWLQENGWQLCEYYTVSEKNGPTLKRCSLKLHGSIFMIFYRNIQKALE